MSAFLLRGVRPLGGDPVDLLLDAGCPLLMPVIRTIECATAESPWSTTFVLSWLIVSYRCAPPFRRSMYSCFDSILPVEWA